MRTRRAPYFLTLVLSALLALASEVSATPAPPQPDLDRPTEPENEKTDPDKNKIDTISITPVGEPTQGNSGDVVGSEYFFPYRKSMSPRVGAIWNSDEYAEDQRILYLVGFQFLYQTRNLKNYEAGLDLISNSTGVLHFSRRWFLARTRFRPYAKAGGGVRLVPRDGLATVARLTNFQARGAIGFERLLLAPLSFRTELELIAGTREFEAILTAGYSWAW